MKKIFHILILLMICSFAVKAQDRGLTNTSKSKFSVVTSTNLDAVHWTKGFWAERYKVYKDTMILSMWKTLDNPNISHFYRNFQVAAGEMKGVHKGPPFDDGDFYKWLEGVAAVYAVTKEPKLDTLMDTIISVIAKAQRPDGYIHTPVIIKELNKRLANHTIDNTVVGTTVGDNKSMFSNRLNFETYNLGHLMTAGIVHYRATGKKTLLNVAIKATNFLCNYYDHATASLARSAICPSHYMGVVEMYRTTGNPRYLKLAKELINIRGMVKNGTDQNQDRIPFRKQRVAMGHAVRANYLYAGVADVYAETGDTTLLTSLKSIWKDITTRKMYVTGACGAIYDGVSPDGTSYHPDSIQQIHQAYGRAYQLPNATAYNETCANIGNLLFNWRMFQISGKAKYIDVLETALYNSILSGVSLDGKRFFYTNPLRISKDFPYKLRWSKDRTSYISCFCCPPNTVRTLCEVQDYAYSLGKDAIYCNLYSGNQISTTLGNDGKFELSQKTDYPWNGDVKITVDKMPNKAISLNLRIPSWCNKATIKVNGKTFDSKNKANTYTHIKRIWHKGDVVELHMAMPVTLLESNPLVEETRNQTCIKRGPIVYCLEGMDIAGGKPIDDVMIPEDIHFKTRKEIIDGSPIVVLDGEALLADESSWKNTLYRPVNEKNQKVKITLIPYYAWDNRGISDMTVWMPLVK